MVQLNAAAFATPALKNSASELATTGVKNLFELLGVSAEGLFRVLFLTPPRSNYRIPMVHFFHNASLFFDFHLVLF